LFGVVFVVGKIKRLVVNRGFGFIAVEGGPDTFLHASQLIDVVWDERLLSMTVEFDVQETDRGPQAFNVRPVND
jgi:cold shock protein